MAILHPGLLLACTIIFALSSATSVEDTECAVTQYVDIGTVGLIPCSCNGSYFALISWYNVNEAKNILLLAHGEKSGDGYKSTELDIYPNGSLVIYNVTASHESLYRVTTATSTSSQRFMNFICVHTIVKPAITIPVVEECSNTYSTTCAKSTADSVQVNCFVRDSRPAVNLSWSLRAHGGDHILPSNYRNFTMDNVTYTSHVTATFSFGESSVLSLLVCRANSVPLNLVEDENVLLIEKEMDYTSLATPIRIYLKIHSPINLSCADLGLNIVIWKWSPERDAFETLYVSIFQNSNHKKISNREYRLEDEGSLSLPNTLVEHEGLYSCVYDNGVSGGIVLYDVLVIVDPTPVFPVIDGCNHQQYCVLEKQHQDVLTCSVLGIRPKVALEWRAFREESAIDFTQHQFKETQSGDLYDISLTVNFDFTQTTQNKVTVECRAVGENAELFNLSTKVDLLFPNVLPTEQRSHTSTITIIAVVVIMMMIIITAAVVILCRLRARKMKMKRNKRGDTENEDVPMMENKDDQTGHLDLGSKGSSTSDRTSIVLDSFSSADQENIILENGDRLPVSSTLENLHIRTNKGKEFTQEQVIGLLSYGTQCRRLHNLSFMDCLLPLSFPSDSLSSIPRLLSIEVQWRPSEPGLHLDCIRGKWISNSKEATTLETKDQSSLRLLCSSIVHLRRTDSKQLQMSTILLLQIASSHNIPISDLGLQWSFSGFDGKDIRLESGLSLSSLSSVEKISINAGIQKKEFTEEEVIGIINYGIKSPRFKELWLNNCKLPSSINPDTIPEESRSRNIKVISSKEARYLDLRSGQWRKPDDIQTIIEMCSGNLSIQRDTSKSVQKSVIEFLVEASNHDIPIFRVSLNWSFSKIDEDGNIILSSGLSLPIITSIERMSIQTEKGREMNKHEVNGILNYVQHSQRFKQLNLKDCLLPSSIHVGPSLSTLKSRGVKVFWTPDSVKNDEYYRLDLDSGLLRKVGSW